MVGPPVKNPTRNERIIEMHRSGYSAGLILQMLPDATLNMINGVIGRAKKRGLLPPTVASTHKLAPHAMGGDLRSGARPKPKAVPLRMPPAPAVKAEPMSAPAPIVTARPSRKPCAYPIGDPKRPGFRFCGAPTCEGSSYCAEHHARCWTTAPAVKPLPEGGRRGRHTFG